MFEGLIDRFSGIIRNLRNQGRISESNLKESLREIRMALLEADVNYKVVKDFTDRVKGKALGRDVIKSLTPGQVVVKIVHDELVTLLGGAPEAMDISPPHPVCVFMVGLQGSGKTTTCGKLASFLRKEKGLESLLVAADTRRPAAAEQLRVVGSRVNAPVVTFEGKKNALAAVKDGLAEAKVGSIPVVIVDTAGRLHIDDELMEELSSLKKEVSPRATFLVADSMTGQDAVNIAGTFKDKIGLDGIILTKLDGDARGGAALSMREVTGCPILFAGVGEKEDALEVFYPERMAGRILGMGDVVSLVEKVQETYDVAEAEKLAARMRKAEFTLEDFRDQMKKVSSMGSLSDMLAMVPGVGKALKGVQVDEKIMVRFGAIIDSMTPAERRDPTMIDISRRRRIAKGSGTNPEDVSRLIRQFIQAKKMMSKMTRFMGKGKMGKFGGFPGMPF